MSDWSNNNLSCISTWIGLRILEQNKKVFNSSGDVRMRSLAFWNAAATQQMRTLQVPRAGRIDRNPCRQPRGVHLLRCRPHLARRSLRQLVDGPAAVRRAIATGLRAWLQAQLLRSIASDWSHMPRQDRRMSLK